MSNTIRHGWTSWSEEVSASSPAQRPNPILTFIPVSFEGEHWQPKFGDRNALLLLKRNMPKKVSFTRAYSGWRAGGSKDERELGEGRAFFRWLQRHDLSIDWKATDFTPHPFFAFRGAPKHSPDDEMAHGLSFAIQPVQVAGRKVKLYVQDDDMLSLLNLPYGDEEDFLELVMRYVTQRFQWEQWRAPAPNFLDWLKGQGKRPLFVPGQLGFTPPLPLFMK